MKSFPILILLGSLAAAPAQEVVPPKSNTVVKAETLSEPTVYRAATRSTFVPSEQGRNPFWPIGFTPRPKSLMNDEQLLRIPVEQYKVTSIILDTPSIAVINGKDYTRGQFLPLATATGTIRLLITSIQDGLVVVQYKTLVGKIPISRK